jgi:FixJ family two-component response regulator
LQDRRATLEASAQLQTGDLMEKSTVFVVDDDPSVLRAVGRLLRSNDYEVQLYPSAIELLKSIEPGTPGCLLVDLAMPEFSGLELQDRLRALGDTHPVVFLSGHGSIQASVSAMKAGALDFIEKPCEEADLLATVRRALERDRQLREQRNAVAQIKRRLESLTPRESEVFRHVIAGRLNKQIAAVLGTAEKTVKVHRARVMQKMGVRSVAELTRAADCANILPAT